MIANVKNEVDFRNMLEEIGFSTNNKKHENENGYDVVALKDGHVYLIEFKKLEKRDNGIYRYNGDIKGDILLLSMEDGRCFFWGGEGISLTKTARLLSIIYSHSGYGG